MANIRGENGFSPPTWLQVQDSSFSFSDLPEQALVHAVKGRDILLLPRGHVTSHDPPPDPIHHLAVAHCVVGRVLTIQGKYPWKILNVFSNFCQMGGLTLLLGCSRSLSHCHEEKYLLDEDNKPQGVSFLEEKLSWIIMSQTSWGWEGLAEGWEGIAEGWEDVGEIQQDARGGGRHSAGLGYSNCHGQVHTTCSCAHFTALSVWQLVCVMMIQRVTAVLF